VVRKSKLEKPVDPQPWNPDKYRVAFTIWGEAQYTKKVIRATLKGAGFNLTRKYKREVVRELNLIVYSQPKRTRSIARRPVG